MRVSRIVATSFHHAAFRARALDGRNDVLRAILVEQVKLMAKDTVQGRLVARLVTSSGHPIQSPTYSVKFVSKRNFSIYGAHQQLRAVLVEVLCFRVHIDTIAEANLDDIRTGKTARHILNKQYSISHYTPHMRPPTTPQ